MFDPTRLFACLALTCVLAACDSDDSMDSMDSSSGDATADPTADPSSGGPADGRCSMDNAIMTCDAGDCAFDPAEVDCTAACANIAALCASNDCSAQCSGLESDASLCAAACEGSKNLMCSNVVFGCYAADDTCDEVGSCVDANSAL